jgi:alkanesulfonate monooxygenase SsuD/methylene tetrahydromethanopterin reductase-like flavin-dependent oxidoreductase (luciferase family)
MKHHRHEPLPFRRERPPRAIAPEWTDKTRKVEALGHATLTIPDHLTGLVAPVPALLSAAEAAKTLCISTNVLNNAS